MDNSLPEEPLSENPDIPEDEEFPEDLRDSENAENAEDEATAESASSHPVANAEYTVLNGVQTVVSIALVMATLLTLWNPRKVFNTPSLSALVEAKATEAALEVEEQSDQGTHIALLVGHWEDSNPGEVCADGLVEADVNHAIAVLVAEKLEKEGYSVDMFPEYDLNFLNYEGLAFIAIYSGSCVESPLPPSGFKVGGSFSAQNPDLVDRLATCISQEYQAATNLPFTYEVISAEHASYHIFRDISANTPAVRLEMGSLKTDRTLLVDQAEKTADGIAAGILCYLNNRSESD